MKLNYLTLVFLFITAFTFGQGNQISGTVTDENNRTLPGVSILLKGTKMGTVSDVQGNFTIKVSGTNSTIVFDFMGYASQEVKVGSQRTLKVKLQPSINQLDEVVLTVQARGQKKAIQDQINSNTIKNVVAGDRLQENPDANSTEAIGRLPGVSVTRSAGEGSGLVVRGLAPKYTNVTLNGVRMAATGANGRETNISGISQYALEGVEVYKSITADMDGNSVAGTINLKLRETPKKMFLNVMSTTGYNNLNKYIGNYKLLGEFGNRFFKDKLGFFVSVTNESVNRSAETQSSTLDHVATTSADRQVDFLQNNVGLNLNSKIKNRSSAMVNFDYRLGSTTKIGAYGLYNRSNDNNTNQSHTYNATGSGGLNYNLSQNNSRINELYQSSLSGQTKLNWMMVDYGVTLSQAITDDPNSRSWSFAALSPEKLIKKDPLTGNQYSFTTPFRLTLQPQTLPLLYDDSTTQINSFVLNSLGLTKENLTDKNLDTYINLNFPVKITDKIAVKFKTGGIFREKNRFRDVNSGNVQVSVNQFFRRDIANDLPFIMSSPASDILANGFLDGKRVDNFLNGQYNFGPTFNFDRLNQVTDSWSRISQYYFDQGKQVWGVLYPADKLGFNQNIANSNVNDQDIKERYKAGYVMAEFNVGKWLMFLPGLRYEKTDTNMKGFDSFQPSTPSPTYEPLPGTPTAAKVDNEFFLPMIHLRISPSQNFYTHLAYTETLSRPTFDQISPNSHANTGLPPFSFQTNDPNLKVEQWKSYDLQFAYHGKKISLFSVSGFYKKVNNQIWNKSFTRLKGDPLIGTFPDDALVLVSRPENHPNEITLKGVEVELQTSFGYLDNMFKYFTVALNYTFTKSTTFYPITRVDQIITPKPGGGRPIVTFVRVDSAYEGPMTNQPKHLGNASLGYNRKGLNVWLSFQYSGGILEGVDKDFNSVNKTKDNFYRYDLQVSQKLSGIFKGFQIIGNFANLNDLVEYKHYAGDPRVSNSENYGWTVDLGLRYTL